MLKYVQSIFYRNQFTLVISENGWWHRSSRSCRNRGESRNLSCHRSNVDLARTVSPKNFSRRGAPVRGTDILSITISSVHGSKTNPPVLYFYKVYASSLLWFLENFVILDTLKLIISEITSFKHHQAKSKRLQANKNIHRALIGDFEISLTTFNEIQTLCDVSLLK